jgi:DnaJ-class molecular chaperone
MRYTFEEEFRLDHPETVGETDRHFDLDNYKDWLEAQLIEARKQLALYNVVGRSKQLVCTSCDGSGGRVIYDTYLKCKKCNGSGAN